MSLVGLKEMLNDARKNKYAVAAFDVSNYEMIKSVMEVAEEMESPVILMGIEADLEGKGIDYFASMTKLAAKEYKVPVCIHLDHATDFSLIKKAIDKGFNSVMYDGSILPYDENLNNTKEICQYAHKFGISVEAELGHVGDDLVGRPENPKAKDEDIDPEDLLTDPNQIQGFVEGSGVDALAVAVGTAHGIYTKKPVLRFERLQEINNKSSVPLVLHGGSGTPEKDVKKAINLGICKVNIYSEVIYACYKSLKGVLNNTDNLAIWPVVANKKPIENMKDIIRKKIIMCGSKNKA